MDRYGFPGHLVVWELLNNVWKIPTYCLGNSNQVLIKDKTEKKMNKIFNPFDWIQFQTSNKPVFLFIKIQVEFLFFNNS